MRGHDPDRGGLAAEDPTLAAKCRFRAFDIPDPPIQDPRKLSDEDLIRFGLPPKPDADRQPKLFRLWSETFGRELHFLPYDVERAFALVAGLDTSPRPREDKLEVAGGRFEASRNWAGAYITPNESKTFIQLAARWKVPTASVPEDAALPTPGDTIDYQCANWIGVDGQRRYLNSSLPQIGTLQSVQVDENGDQTTAYFAWTQWWDRSSKTSKPAPIPDFEINPDDIVTCTLQVTDEHTVAANIVNETATPIATTMSVQMTAPFVTLPNGTELQLSISGATAEWILERPAVVGTPKVLHDFANYQRTRFRGCYAIEADEGGGSPTLQILKSPRFIRMYEVREQPQRTAYISMPSRINNDSFRVHYGDFKD